MKDYIRLLRPKHYIKNGLILVPLVFSGGLFVLPLLGKAIWGIGAFCFLSSCIYIINDLQDLLADQEHEVKRFRPIASGRIQPARAKVAACLCFMIAMICHMLTGEIHWRSSICLLIYFVLNFLYSNGLKNVPLVDIAILASGFLLRIVYGAAIINATISSWLYLTVISMSFYLGLGKRRNELSKAAGKAEKVRSVLGSYNYSFLDKNMYMCVALTITFYALWCIDPLTSQRDSLSLLIWTVPLVMLICMKYSLCVESGLYADPVDTLYSSKGLIALICIYVAVVGIVLYGPLLRQVSGVSKWV